MRTAHLTGDLRPVVGLRRVERAQQNARRAWELGEDKLGGLVAGVSTLMLLVTGASLVVTSALLVVTRSY